MFGGIGGSWGGWMPFLGPGGASWGCQWMRSGTVVYRMHCCHPPWREFPLDASAGVKSMDTHTHGKIWELQRQVLSTMTVGLQLLGL